MSTTSDEKKQLDPALEYLGDRIAGGGNTVGHENLAVLLATLGK